MRSEFEVRPVSFTAIHELPGAWQLSDYRGLLTSLDFEDIDDLSDSELREMCLMALSDRELDEAAAHVLRHRLGTRLREGQIRDIAHDMIDEPLWEDYSDIRVHEQLYNANQLLYDAFNGKFPRPKAVQLEVEVEARDDDGEVLLEEPTEAFLARLLAAGMDEDALLHRLFEEQLAGHSFPEAESILWQFGVSAPQRRVATFWTIGSGYWLNGMKDITTYDAIAYPDTQESPPEP